MNICSVIVQCKKENAELITLQLEKQPEITVFGGQAEGKIIATIEVLGEHAISEKILELNQIPGVIDTLMVYHQEEENEKLEHLI